MPHDQLLRGLYAGIRAEQPFQDFLCQLAAAVGGTGASITIGRGPAGRAVTIHAGQPGRGGWQAPAEPPVDDPLAGLPLGRAMTLREFLDFQRVPALPCIPPPVPDTGTQNLLGLDVAEPGGARIRLRAARGTGDPDFDGRARDLFSRLAPDLSEAGGLFLQLDGTRTHQDLYAAILNRLAVGAAVVDGGGHVVSMTAKAQDILQRHHLLSPGDGPRRLTGGRLRGDELSEALRHLTCPHRAAETPWPMTIPGENGEMLNLTIRPTHCDPGQGHPLGGTALVIVSEASSPDGPSAPALSRRFGLTPAEGELAALLAQGLDLDTASAILEISKNTAKTQLRMIFAKTQVSRQSSLVRLLLRSVDELTPPRWPLPCAPGQAGDHSAGAAI